MKDYHGLDVLGNAIPTAEIDVLEYDVVAAACAWRDQIGQHALTAGQEFGRCYGPDGSGQVPTGPALKRAHARVALIDAVDRLRGEYDR